MTDIMVGVVGSTGETGGSIINGLLEAGGFSIIALTRPASVVKPATNALKDRGVEIRSLDLSTSQDEIVAALKGIEVLISAIGPMEQLEQIPLATAAKTAGVKRFLPCGGMPVVPAGGIHMLRDVKETIAFPELPSGRIDYAVGIPGQRLPGDGNVPNAITDLRDIGRYVAKIIVDDRTLNKYVFVFNELHTPNEICDLLEKLSGEKLPRNYVDKETLRQRIANAEAKMANGTTDYLTAMTIVTSQYLMSWGIRGDNTPENAKYLGYVTSKELYPDMHFTKFENYLRDEVLAGSATVVYEARKEEMAKMMKNLQEAH
ncbi:hypothetical protein LTR53_006341 [Teratosphaeriaceae sp. CCFEE 6253]|nr:hypothetical protein LTR53_006341 [Teratosphaeriaceae sp. CCFEE 6253]